MLVKVCGIADQEFLHRVGELPLHFAGFIFYPESPRYVVGRIKNEHIKNLPDSVLKVGVFVNETLENILAEEQKYSLNAIQLHGDEDNSFAEQLAGKTKVIKAFHVDEDFDFSLTVPFEKSCSLFLFDTKAKQYGGTGRKFNWELLQNYRGSIPFLLSGGIGPEDVAKINAFKHPQFAGIDINSGFETAAGKKDIEKIKNFLNQIT